MLVLKTGLIPISSGLKEGDLIITTAPSSLHPGEKVNLKIKKLKN